jgi:hypothetical protein
MHLHLFITQGPYFFNSYFHLGITTLKVLKTQSKCALAKNLHDFFLRNVFSYLQLVGINVISIQACPHKMNKISFQGIFFSTFPFFDSTPTMGPSYSLHHEVFQVLFLG